MTIPASTADNVHDGDIDEYLAGSAAVRRNIAGY